MALHWMHLLPVDRYVVRTTSFINEADRKIITLLYQPLIGAIAHSLYFALQSELERDQYTSIETTHKTLMTMMGLPLDKIYEERKKLEGIGLLNVYKQKQDEDIIYLYELQKPFSPHEFFKDDVLSVYLYNRVGKYRYLQLRDRFTINKINKDNFKEITLSFSDVFTSLHHSEISAQQGELSTSLVIDSQSDIVNNDSSESSYTILEEAFDFSLLITYLSNMINPKTLFTEKVKETIVRLAFVYRIDPYEMSKIIQDSLLHDDTVDLDVMREKVKNWYKFTYESEPPGLGFRTHPEKYRTMSGKEPKTEEEEMILLYETESPLTLLESKSAAGAKVPLGDAKIVETLLLDYKLLPGVANVLIDFILEINDMKLTKSYVEKIAGQWARKNVKTVKEAMALAKGEYKKREQWDQGTAEAAATTERPVKQRQNNTNRYVRKDRLPKWLIEAKKEVTSKQEDDDITKVKQELEEKFKLLKLQRQEG
ncbi:DnaD domain protein [Anaerobacillus sp. CMMVII]|uniref:replication initiation and membrane attachment family protein n=1 Tax=Anaerobacillus sp. CMMVII TaxID=2755588 RepID=UPI0021B82C03|nr:DnaD domain protein [Anaerobacillus sp. CMMVII]MCT8137414.1 DnaD domain protein [Anaerobacillus sp. CMMVII]